MKEHRTEKLNYDKAFMDSHSSEELADMCENILRQLCTRAEELSELFLKLKDMYPAIFCVADFSLICAISAAPFKDLDAPFKVIMGTKPGITNVAQHIIKGLQEANSGPETRG